MNKTAAWDLLGQYVHEESLKKHCYATGAVMKAIASYLGEDAERWELIGILHDIDFELIHGDMHQHGKKGAEILAKHGFDEDFITIVQGHNHFLHTDRYERTVEIALQASDSVSGLIIACALVKKGRLSEVTAKTVVKKAREKSFAAGCDRNRIALIAPIMDLPAFYEIALQGLMEYRDKLGLT